LSDKKSIMMGEEGFIGLQPEMGKTLWIRPEAIIAMLDNYQDDSFGTNLYLQGYPEAIYVDVPPLVICHAIREVRCQNKNELSESTQ